ncbi:ABC transporter substrate-binding protein [Rhizobium sp. KVB221]|uniref:ABC transporter substrate-binding protein n=1 Tax=Rhizobium setariae TaxID=2801340 RepID=A0A937CN55_9HYPH|nr:ABC transporter substrate-binding protein [Rhizobium setariae]MBL0373416.1 ABC transporter substrate-binding protein [Rhizobium setariae]
MKKLFVLAAVFCAGSYATTSHAAFDCKDGAVTIGVARAKTGGFAFFDVAGARGLEVGIDEINAAGGIEGCEIKLIQGDTQSNPAMTGQVADELIKQGAQLIIAPSDFDAGVGASIAAQASGLFSISPEASSVAWTQAVQPNFFVGGMTEGDLGATIGGFANKKGWEGAYIVTNTAYSFFTEQEKVFRTVYKGKIVGQDAVNEDTSDYSAVVSKIRSAGDEVKVIFLNDYFPHVGTFLKQARAAGIKAAVVGNGTFSSTTLPQVVGADGLQDVYYVASAYYEGKDINPALKRMIDAYQTKFGTFPENTNAIVSYYAAYILADALKTAGSTDASALTKAVLAQKDLKLPGAIYYGWADRYPSVSATVVGFDASGAFKEVELLDPRSFK